MMKRFLVLSMVMLTGSGALAGCMYKRTETERVNTPPPNTVAVVRPSQRVYTYSEGRYELRGDGTSASPYYWVWIPTGTQAVTPPPLPPLPR